MEDNTPVKIGDLLGKYRARTSKTGSERGSILDMFLVPLNVSREGKYSPLTHSRLARIFKGISNQELYEILSRCKQAKSFSAYFWWYFRQRKNNEKM